MSRVDGFSMLSPNRSRRHFCASLSVLLIEEARFNNLSETPAVFPRVLPEIPLRLDLSMNPVVLPNREGLLSDDTPSSDEDGSDEFSKSPEELPSRSLRIEPVRPESSDGAPNGGLLNLGLSPPSKEPGAPVSVGLS
mmetsp:Transcript_1370/g.2473  ORF Transcript_1370/g.2473 Transcript_1370/m.2473 type:complete len:137 (+) Transcript_1370:209-619(+)